MSISYIDLMFLIISEILFLYIAKSINKNISL